LLGFFFHSSLWWTTDEVRRLPVPLFMFIVCFLLRISVILIGFYEVISNYSEHLELSLAICLFGFWIARFLITSFAYLKKVRKNSNGAQ
jgi:F1F0 ATPase subunit 2